MTNNALQVTYLIVDDMHQNIPELSKDQYWDTTDFQLPYTEATIHYQREAVLGSAADIEYVRHMIGLDRIRPSIIPSIH